MCRELSGTGELAGIGVFCDVICRLASWSSLLSCGTRRATSAVAIGYKATIFAVYPSFPTYASLLQ